jgi:A/G-specific adenine glycosylase
MDPNTLQRLCGDAAWKRQVRRRLLAWYARHARELPWRNTGDPYRVWISEMMLQQTQVVTVQGYFARFMQRFPSVQSLAAAPLEEVLRIWEGLGYYRRARQLHQAARILVDQHQGQFPRSTAALEQLPGIGKYTAGAILSLAFDLPAPIVEANSARLLARLSCWPQPLAISASHKALWLLSESLLPPRQAGRFNQAMMDLGSLVCRPRAPDCPRCPLRTLCAARAEGQQEVIPTAGKRVRYQDLQEAAVVVRCHDQVLLRRCGHGERWAGLWDFLRFAVPADAHGDADGAVLKQASLHTGRALERVESLGTIKHGVTRYRITLHCYQATFPPPTHAVADPLCWYPLDQLPQLPLSSTGRTLYRTLRPLALDAPGGGTSVDRSPSGNAPPHKRGG